ncbi:hypothetical protein C0991_012303, partial [Blastosporella zonata]
GVPIRDAFRRGLGYAAQWYDNLVIRLDKQVDDAVVTAEEQIQQVKVNRTPPSIPPFQELVSQATTASIPLEHAECARVLRQRCPACFGGSIFGRSLEEQ